MSYNLPVAPAPAQSPGQPGASSPWIGRFAIVTVATAVAVFIALVLSVSAAAIFAASTTGNALETAIYGGSIVRTVVIPVLVALIVWLVARNSGVKPAIFAGAVFLGYVLSIASWGGKTLLIGTILDPLGASWVITVLGFFIDGAILAGIGFLVARFVNAPAQTVAP